MDTLVKAIIAAILFLLNEKIKQHPTSQAALDAKKMKGDIKAANKPPKSSFKDSPGPSAPGPVQIRDPKTGELRPVVEHRVPIAGDAVRDPDTGELKGVAGPGTEADLL